MQNNIKKCSSKEHEELEAHSFCRVCKIYICNKCEIIHSKLCQNHQTFLLEKDNDEIFTDFVIKQIIMMNLNFFVRLIINYVVLRV